MIPIYIVSGFLGSGKTSFLNALLSTPAMAGSAVVVNEIGEIGVDHDLIVQAPDQALVLSGGCICCSMRGSAVDKIAQLVEAGPAPIRRVFVETTGVADPLPIIEALASAPALSGRAGFRQLLTVVDGLAGPEMFDRHEAARRQVKVADMLLVSKTDMVGADGRSSLRRAARALNALTPLHDISRGRLPDAVVDILARPDAALIIQAEQTKRPGLHPSERCDPPHDNIQTEALRFPGVLPRHALETWLDELLSCFGGYVLRVKGLFHVTGIGVPVVLQAVRHIVSPPEMLPSWSDDDRDNRVVVIADGIDASLLKDNLAWLASQAA